ncbi:hypothetical protein UMM65_04360 [Aureibaculum sp. 2210JD6-5]|uniref:hypothetical protein n=1 Tax=Aureibaculum sp. 2210JD6-5 TaxID=3103957 RepID=UPI002AAEBB51|nr:hypothetical protein [Aureibaculum sp. 2210JD6-5]MDY7394462.1 hypothetical protein [Aureibaculum sp. 2210JD6-5]
MKKVFSIIFFQIISISCFSQNKIIELNSVLKKIEVVDDLSLLDKKKFPTLSILTIQNEMERDIDFGYRHFRKLIMTHSDGDFRIDIISYGDSIKLGITTVIDWKDNEPKEYEFFSDSNSFITNYLKKHNAFYETDIQKDQLIEQLNDEYTVGFGCGIVGMDIPKYSQLMQRYTKQKNRKKLNAWLRSFSPELQTLGTIGLLNLGSVGKDEMNIIKHLEKRNSKINTCSGCLYGLEIEFKRVIKIKIDY